MIECDTHNPDLFQDGGRLSLRELLRRAAGKPPIPLPDDVPEKQPTQVITVPGKAPAEPVAEENLASSASMLRQELLQSAQLELGRSQNIAELLGKDHLQQLTDYLQKLTTGVPPNKNEIRELFPAIGKALGALLLIVEGVPDKNVSLSSQGYVDLDKDGKQLALADLAQFILTSFPDKEWWQLFKKLDPEKAVAQQGFGMSTSSEGHEEVLWQTVEPEWQAQLEQFNFSVDAVLAFVKQFAAYQKNRSMSILLLNAVVEVQQTEKR